MQTKFRPVTRFDHPPGKLKSENGKLKMEEIHGFQFLPFSFQFVREFILPTGGSQPQRT